MKLKSKCFQTALTVLFLTIGQAAWAQKTVTGIITDQAKNPIVGATVSIKGTTTGTTTASDGHFSIHVPSDKSVLQISYVGYVPQNIAVEGRANIGIITMLAESHTLNEVVITG